MKKKIKKEKKKKIFVISLIVVLILIVFIFVYQNFQKNKEEVNSFEDCLKKGYLVEESLPRRCLTSSGKIFVENITNKEDYCKSFGGVYLREFEECEEINEEQCKFLGGKFNPCASSCRHNEAEMCIMVCVPVCSFKNEL